MRLSELIAGLERNELDELALRIVPGAQELDRNLWPHNLELVLTQTGHVEQTILGRRPPVASLLLRLVDAKDHVIALRELRDEVAAEGARWCRQVTAGELANRIPERALIYRRMLEAAWRNDLALDASEVRLLRLLREELGLLRIEHFLLAYHETIQPYWRRAESQEVVINALREHGIVFVLDSSKLALPNELVSHIRNVLGVSMSRDSARRLLQSLDSGSHLKSALADHDLPTSGSKQERIERLVEHFVPMPRVIDTMHIADARELARTLGLQVSGAKEEVVLRIVECFASGGDLTAAEEHEEVEEIEEDKVLSRGAFAALFGELKGHELQRLLMAFDLRHSGTKEIRIASLWESPFSEQTLLGKMTNSDLEELLWKSDLGSRGAKAEKISRLVEAFRVAARVRDEQRPRGAENDAEPDTSGDADGRPEVVIRIAELLRSIELSSTSPNRFDPLRTELADCLDLEPKEVGVKYLGDAKNHRNRIGEALRGVPRLLVLLTAREEGDAVLEAARSRLAVSADTHFLTLLEFGTLSDWICGAIMAAVETPLLERLARVFPDAESHVVGFPSSVEHEHVRELVAGVERELITEWARSDAPPETRIRRALVRAFERPDTVVRTKHISDARNVGNRISEAVGAGCGALVLVVAHGLAEIAQAEAARQLRGVREPVMAIVVAEADDGGYSEPAIVIGSSATAVA